jgi:hypothetical protein
MLSVLVFPQAIESMKKQLPELPADQMVTAASLGEQNNVSIQRLDELSNQFE